MNKQLTTLVTVVAIILLTATFGFAQFAASATTAFPYFQFGCLVIGGLTLVSLKRKYEKMYVGETIGIFALYTIMVSLFTNPVIDAIKMLVS